MDQAIVQSTAAAQTADDQTVDQDLPSDDLVDDGLLDAGEPGQEDDDSEEIEHEGEKYRIPKKLKPALMFNADYTRKTQELAERGRAFEAREQEIVQRQQVQQQHIQDVANLMAMDRQLEQFKSLDWNGLANANLEQAQQLRFNMETLQRARDAAANDLHAKSQRSESEAKQATANRTRQAAAELARDIPGWSPELQSKIANACMEVGYSPQMLERTDFAPFVKLAHKAYLYDQLVKERTKPSAAAPAKPITKVGGAAPATKNPATMSDAEFAAWRRRQIARRT